MRWSFHCNGNCKITPSKRSTHRRFYTTFCTLPGYECYATATLELEVYVPRESSYVYDSEEKSGAYLDWNYAEIERDIEFTVDFSLELTKPRKVDFEHTSITLNYGRAIQVYLDIDAADNYK